MARIPENARTYLNLGPLEYQIMNSVWQHGTWITIGDVLDDLNKRSERPHAYSTVKTIFVKLVRKGLLQKRVAGKAHEFAAVQGRAVSEREGVRRIVKPLLNPSNPLFAHLVDEIASDEETLRHFERLLSERHKA
ncbi:MAG TPA: BlaI/MecI/CopY family transcriptional regulator [Candidatus Baltobacteraceae bacterium]|nr:BlaI/MecI/CopY family transcriptional regulator [Candidatus Baltobacteraceae bacterium]